MCSDAWKALGKSNTVLLFYIGIAEAHNKAHKSSHFPAIHIKQMYWSWCIFLHSLIHNLSFIIKKGVAMVPALYLIQKNAKAHPLSFGEMRWRCQIDFCPYPLLLVHPCTWQDCHQGTKHTGQSYSAHSETNPLQTAILITPYQPTSNSDFNHALPLPKANKWSLPPPPLPIGICITF